MQQLLGITQQETVVVLIKLSHLLLDTAQQSELVQMAQGEVCRLIEFPLAGSLLYRIAQDVTQRAFCQRADEVSSWIRP